MSPSWQALPAPFEQQVFGAAETRLFPQRHVPATQTSFRGQRTPHAPQAVGLLGPAQVPSPQLTVPDGHVHSPFWQT